MIAIENVVLPSHEWWEAVARGMRNSYNSWDKMDTQYIASACFGPHDKELAKRLVAAGPSHAKFMRMIPVIFDVTAPIYWWKEADTYKIGTVRNSCSTMHRIAEKEFEWYDFSVEHVDVDISDPEVQDNYFGRTLQRTIDALNNARTLYLATPDNMPRLKKAYWWQMIELLPSSYNQRATISVNYEVLSNIYIQRKDHKLDEWHKFCDFIKTLPESDLITKGE